MTAQIVQHNKVLSAFFAGNAKHITERIKNRAEVTARNLINNGRMKPGYYDLQLVTLQGCVIDSQDKIA